MDGCHQLNVVVLNNNKKFRTHGLTWVGGIGVSPVPDSTRFLHSTNVPRASTVFRPYSRSQGHRDHSVFKGAYSPEGAGRDITSDNRRNLSWKEEAWAKGNKAVMGQG